MGRPSKIRQLNVWMNGELVGHWLIAPQGRHEFRYAASWLDTATSRPLSLSMPLQPSDTPYRDERIEAFFDNLLPDSPDIRRRIQSRFGTASTAAFDLLTEIGRDCAGAVQLLAPDDQPEGIHSINGEPLTDDAIANSLRATVSAPALGHRDDDDFRISIAGAQEKTALLWHEGCWHRPRGTTPTTHIFKLPLGRVGNMQADLTTSVENEWLCSQIVRAYGLDTAHCDMAQFEDQKVLVVERFDRRLAQDKAWWIRLPQEDMCQATGTAPGHKYESDGGPGIRDIMSLLLGARTAQPDRKTFFKAQVLFWMLAATDGHAKNFSVFIEPGGRFSLTPLYDILSAHPIMGYGANQIAPEKARMAMAATGKNRHYRWSEIQRRHWLDTANACDLGPEAEQLIIELVERTPTVLEHVSAVLPDDFPKNVAEPIFDGLKSAAKLLNMSNH
ncbi:MAG: type II toxin-antitoxin system HipA family toxin [Gammaproteobacteria bacterium]